METKREISNSSFTSVMALAHKCQQNIPERYVLPPLQRPNTSHADHLSTNLPIIDLSEMNHPAHRPQLINEVRAACNQLGFFQMLLTDNIRWQRSRTQIETLRGLATQETQMVQVTNHGIPAPLMKTALDSAEEFFNLPSDEKACYASADVHEPIRYGTSVNHWMDEVFYWRDFIKHYANPISDWIHLWPSNPLTYKEKMGSYAKALKVLQKQLMEVIFESLGLNANYLHDDIEEGSQVMTVNCYPSCPKPDLALGLPPHTDFGTITILNQTQQGLEIMDHHEKWHSVPFIQGALIVQLGDQFEVISNGRYKSVPHRAILNARTKRFSIASLHGMHIEKKVGPAPELVDEQHPVAYKEGSFGGFLDFISVKSLSEEEYLNTLKIT